MSERGKFPIVDQMVDKLAESAGDQLTSVVLYGPAAHGDYAGSIHSYNLLIVLADLSLRNVELVGEPVRWWLKRGEPMPRLFSPAFIREAADVFPIEFLDITAYHVVVHGVDPFADFEVHTDHLRVQCERDLREKLMRVQEAFIQTAGKPRHIKRLLADSYPAFADLFRGCLHLLDGAAPGRNIDVVKAFCARAGIDPAPFGEIEQLKNGGDLKTDAAKLFEQYYIQLTKAVAAVDSFGGTP